jgi:hypothetical protein
VSAAIIPATPSNVTFNLANADPARSLVQNALEDAIETVRTDALQPYCLPHIHHLLTTRNVQVSAIDISQFLGPDGMLVINLPADGPPLPEAFIVSIDTTTDNEAIKTAYFHVDTGATYFVTDQVDIA